MFLDPAWHQRWLDTLRDMLDVPAPMRRDMIQFLFDEGFWDEKKLSWAAAEARFAGCLNPHKPEFFKVSEVLALARRFRRYHLLYAMAEDLGFYQPREKPTEQRRQELLERIANAEEKLLDEITAARAELARMDTAPVVHLHPAIREGHGPKFSQPWDGEGDTGAGRF